MHFSSAIIASILAVSALAAPKPSIIAKSVDSRSTNNKRSIYSYTTDKVGAFLTLNTTFESNSADVRVPNLSIPNPEEAVEGLYTISAFLDIHNVSNEAFMAVGVDMAVDLEGTVTYHAYAERTGDEIEYFNDFEVSANDDIHMSVNAQSPYSGTATLLNKNTGKQVSKTFNSAIALHAQSAQFSVFDASAIVDFHSVVFTNCSAYSQGKKIDTKSARKYDIISENTNFVTTGVNLTISDMVTINYT